MEAVWKIEVQDFPAFIVVDDKGNDFFQKWAGHEDGQGSMQAEQDSPMEIDRDFFFGMDTNHDGILSAEELGDGLGITPKEARDLFMTHFKIDIDDGLHVKTCEALLLKSKDLRELMLAYSQGQKPVAP